MFKKIYIEITNNCNLNCSFCPKNSRNKQFIDVENFKIILDKIKNHTKYLYFHLMGEPLLHPNINELIEIACKEYYINITTNGYLIKNIKNKNIRQINISLHSYEEIYNKDLDTYLSDVFESTDDLKENTYINYRLWTKSKHHEKIIAKLNKYYNQNIDGKKSTKLAKNVFLEIEQEFIWPSLNNDYYNEHGTCKGTIDHIGILVDGTVVPCCLDYEGIINLGNIYKSKLSDIIMNDSFTSIQKGFKDNTKIEEMCKHCNFKDIK